MNTDPRLRESERKLERLNESLRLNTRELEKLTEKMHSLERNHAQLSAERVRLTEDIAREERLKQQRILDIQKEGDKKK